MGGCWRRLALFAISAEGGSAVFDARTGQGFGGGKVPWMAPKKASEAMGLRLLGAEGALLPPLAGAAALPWANNLEHASEMPRLSDLSPQGAARLNHLQGPSVRLQCLVTQDRRENRE